MPPFDERIYLRANAEEKAMFTRAAASRGMGLSVWIRFVLRESAERDLQKVAEKKQKLKR